MRLGARGARSFIAENEQDSGCRKGTFALSDAPKLMHYWRLRSHGHLVCRWHRCQARCGSGLAVGQHGHLKSMRVFRHVRRNCWLRRPRETEF